MPKKRLPAIVDRAVWEKVTKERAGIRWDSVVEKVWKDTGGKPRRADVRRKVWEVQGRSTRHDKKKGKASAKNKVESEKHLEIYGRD